MSEKIWKLRWEQLRRDVARLQRQNEGAVASARFHNRELVAECRQSDIETLQAVRAIMTRIARKPSRGPR